MSMKQLGNVKLNALFSAVQHLLSTVHSEAKLAVTPFSLQSTEYGESSRQDYLKKISNVYLWKWHFWLLNIICFLRYWLDKPLVNVLKLTSGCGDDQKGRKSARAVVRHALTVHALGSAPALWGAHGVGKERGWTRRGCGMNNLTEEPGSEASQ